VTILIVGLWPFQAPLNDVSWLDNENGLRFGHHGSLLSSSAFRPRSAENTGAGTLEVWLETIPQKGRRTILAFEGLDRSGVPFSLQQNGDTLIVQRHNVDENGTYRTAEFSVAGALPAKKQVFVAVTLESQETSVYLNGGLVKTSQIQGKPASSFAGRLVLGNSPSASDSWSGQVAGLALYGRRLEAAEVSRHYENWTKNLQPALTHGEGAITAYLFAERGGRVVHNQVDAAADLTIPARYFVLHPEFLSVPWQHYHPTWSYWADAAINVAGFITFGFSIFGYFSSVRTIRNSAAITIALGLITSLTIEVSQAFLPTRDSGVNDLITNTIGTAIGVMLYRSSWLQTLVSRAASLIAPSPSGTIENVEVGSQI